MVSASSSDAAASRRHLFPCCLEVGGLRPSAAMRRLLLYSHCLLEPYFRAPHEKASRKRTLLEACGDCSRALAVQTGELSSEVSSQ